MLTPSAAVPIRLSEEVAAARAEGRAVVALETTILTHGMPYPDNVETALEVESLLRAAGAVPATVAILAGEPRAGLTQAEIKELGRRTDVQKASRRDLAPLVAAGGDGATTVAATMALASRAGISVFVTGGIGGVHRGATTTMDVSADLTELARTPVAVVCAGVKSILDVGLTLEVLETYGVPVVGYGTDRFPAFYVADSGHGVSTRVDDPVAAAKVIAAQQALGLGGLVIANPVPADEALNGEAMEKEIHAAIQDAERLGIRGRNITPWLLAALNERTHGRSLKTNVALVKNNARVGGAIATALASLSKAPPGVDRARR
jgi:pseudouridine-5'-phosphate glycosidase